MFLYKAPKGYSFKSEKKLKENGLFKNDLIQKSWVTLKASPGKDT
jgi:hypothetical protein